MAVTVKVAIMIIAKTTTATIIKAMLLELPSSSGAGDAILLSPLDYCYLGCGGVG